MPMLRVLRSTWYSGPAILQVLSHFLLGLLGSLCVPSAVFLPNQVLETNFCDLFASNTYVLRTMTSAGSPGLTVACDDQSKRSIGSNDQISQSNHAIDTEQPTGIYDTQHPIFSTIPNLFSSGQSRHSAIHSVSSSRYARGTAVLGCANTLEYPVLSTLAVLWSSQFSCDVHAPLRGSHPGHTRVYLKPDDLRPLIKRAALAY